MKRLLFIFILLSSIRAFAQTPVTITSRATWTGSVDNAWFIADVSSNQTRKVSGTTILQSVLKYNDTLTAFSSFARTINHYTKTESDARYLQSFTETDPLWSAAASSYYTKVQADARYSQLGHGHNIVDIANLQNTLDLKASINSPTFTGTVSGITKAMVGLSNVDNTSDATKPVSVIQQSALDLKLTNVMTANGDLIYGGASGAPVRLAANATSTMNVLSSISGGNPSWLPLTAANLPNLPESQITNLTTDLAAKQATLTSGVNIKTINSTSLLGSGNILLQVPITLTTTGTSGAATFDGANLNIPNYATGGGGGGADALGRYIVQISTNAPANAQILASLSTGLLKNTTSTGVLSIAAAGTDYVSPQTTLSGYGITDALSNSTTSTQDGYFSTIKLKDVTTPSHYLTLQDNENLTANHTLSFNTGNADRTLTFSGDATVSGTNTGDQTITLTGDITGSGTGSFATTIGSRKVLYSMMPSVADGKLLGRSAGSAGDAQEITVGSGLTLSSGTLSATGGGTGDMVLASTQTVTGAKTFNAGTFILGAGSTSAAPINFILQAQH
jgi:hypothetical protein